MKINYFWLIVSHAIVVATFCICKILDKLLDKYNNCGYGSNKPHDYGCIAKIISEFTFYFCFISFIWFMRFCV